MPAPLGSLNTAIDPRSATGMGATITEPPWAAAAVAVCSMSAVAR